MFDLHAINFTRDQRVRIQRTDGQLPESVGKLGTVLRVIGPFVVIEVDGVGTRGCLAEFVEPVVTQKQFTDVHPFDARVLGVPMLKTVGTACEPFARRRSTRVQYRG